VRHLYARHQQLCADGKLACAWCCCSSRSLSLQEDSLEGSTAAAGLCQGFIETSSSLHSRTLQ
jgi:hypothetical protein